jgi:hypothetical protein
MQFPRTLDVYADGTLYIPYPIQAAQAEQAAYEYSLDTSVLEDALQGLAKQAINVGGVALSQTLRTKGTMMSAIAYNLCKPYLIEPLPEKAMAAAV